MTVVETPIYIDPAEPVLAARPGPRPLTTRPSPELAFPHQQVTQNAPPALQEELVARAARLPGVTTHGSCVSVPGARAFRLDADLAEGPPAAFQCSTEFAHVHPAGDGSLHLTLPPAVAAEAFAKGWIEPHPISGTPLLFGPRDRRELEIVWQLVITSYRWALGHVADGPGEP